MNWFAIVVGASLGATARYALQKQVDGAIATAFPWGTLLVNLSGCLLFGVVAELIAEHGLMPRQGRMLLLVGFLGSYTTFSTFAYDGLVMLEDGNLRWFLLQLGLSVGGGLLAVWAGVSSVRLLA